MTDQPSLLPGHPADLAVAEADQARIAALAADTVRAAVLGTPTPADQLGATAAAPISGVFVSLHRHHQLMGCIGYCGRPTTLAASLQGAARSAAVDDPRFDGVKAEELPGLEVEVWLLYRWELLPEAPALRERLVTVGEHGLELEASGGRGVFLPCVPVEQHWDVRAFLEHLGEKAGLSRDAWRTPGSLLYRFSGLCLRTEL
jgi:AmmeMemoRadiSam system protein A